MQRPNITVPYNIMMPMPPMLPVSAIRMISASLIVPSRMRGSICCITNGASTAPFRLISMCIATEYRSREVRVYTYPNISPRPKA